MQVSLGRSWLGEGAVLSQSPGETCLPCIPAKNSPGPSCCGSRRKDRAVFALNPEAAQQLGERRGWEREARGLSSRAGVLSLPHPAAAGLPGAWEGGRRKPGRLGRVGRGLCPANRSAEAVGAGVTYPTGPHLL